MLFNSHRQAIYAFGADKRGKSNCYGGCAEAWPPVYTSGRPRAGFVSAIGTMRAAPRTPMRIG